MDRVEAIRAASGSTLYVYSFASLFSWQEHEHYSIHISDDADFIQTTPYRSTLWAAETPQVFRADLYARALRETDWHANPPTDDASLVRRLPGVKVKLVENTSPNPKITYRHDLVSYENL